MRLIDADALADRIEADKKQDNISPGNFFLFKAYIMNAPTIEPDGDTISRSRAIKDISEWATDILHPDRLVKEDAIHVLESLPSAESRTEGVLCALADRACPFQGKEYAWCLTCPHISEEDRNLVKKVVLEPNRERGEWVWDEDAVDWGIGAWVCNKCGSRPQTWWSTDRNKNPLICAGSRFCGNCGADMRGDSE